MRTTTVARRSHTANARRNTTADHANERVTENGIGIESEITIVIGTAAETATESEDTDTGTTTTEMVEIANAAGGVTTTDQSTAMTAAQRGPRTATTLSHLQQRLPPTHLPSSTANPRQPNSVHAPLPPRPKTPAARVEILTLTPQQQQQQQRQRRPQRRSTLLRPRRRR
ncbi:hypothetical protein K461DRAFT_260719 [Myriangium duriaei CBS 260.36]|uniref:Uncharacterized protein n=1 Tax=Myriangium duriaei CBS 260.36 TaxID=1168546 RepID=A0A9P4IX54_9PEZI|nr:hypothetical protein K461DRAFT_260719 [Myriangium duriaei CBS 260.36]